MRNIHKCKTSHDFLLLLKTVLGERRNMHTHMHCPAVYSGSILQGVTHMKISSSKMDIPLKFMVKTFEIQTFFWIQSIIGKFFITYWKISWLIHCLVCLSTHFRRAKRSNLEVSTVVTLPYLSLSANFKLQHETYLVGGDWQLH